MYKIINKKKLIATIILDTIGKIVFAIPRLFSGRKDINSADIYSILVIRTAYIGDVVMTLPLAQVLKRRYPKAKVTFLTSASAKPLFINNPHVDEVLTYDAFWFYGTGLALWRRFIRTLRRKKYDMVIEARADIRDLLFLVFFCRATHKISYSIGGGGYLLNHVVPYPGLTHKVDFHLHLGGYVGCELDDVDGGVYLTSNEQKQATTLLHSSGVKGRFIAVHPGSRLELKRWCLERCAKVYDQLIDTYGVDLVILGAPTETIIATTIQKYMSHSSLSLAGKISLREAAAVMDQAVLFICNDSAPMHIAAAVDTPTVALFGPSESSETGPYKVKSIVVEKKMACRFSCDESHCLNPKFHACMDEIDVNDVYTAACRLLDDRK